LNTRESANSTVFNPISYASVFSALTRFDVPFTNCEMPAFSPCCHDTYVEYASLIFQLGLTTHAGRVTLNPWAVASLNITPSCERRIAFAAATCCFCCAVRLLYAAPATPGRHHAEIFLRDEIGERELRGGVRALERAVPRIEMKPPSDTLLTTAGFSSGALP
jgi:hypothetical protein